MATIHQYAVQITWTGNTGSGTSGYRDFTRDHDITSPDIPGKPAIRATADPSFRGYAGRWNPDELFIAALSQCHMLWYLVRCARAGIIVTDCRDHAQGTMSQNEDGGGQFTEVLLQPSATTAAPPDRVLSEILTEQVHPRELAEALHDDAHRLCFIANSVNTPVRHAATITIV